MKKGCIHLYCGEGKGKTTAALGLVLRASGAGLHVAVARFMKDSHSSELKSLALLPGVNVLPAPDHIPFFRKMTDEEKAVFQKTAHALWEQAIASSADVLMLDELCAAMRAGFVEEEEVIRFLKEKPPEMEVIITGRNPSPALQAMADYHSEIRCIRHPYQQGLKARKGIEF